MNFTMKKKLDPRIIVIIVLLVIFIILTVIYIKSDNSSSSNSTISKSNLTNVDESDTVVSSNETSSSSTTSTSTSKISSSGEVSSAITEQLELHATYYFSEIYVEENTKVSAGENILLYTNGEYLTAPYDCIITSISVPEVDEQCTNKHYIEIEATNTLQMSITVNETNINKVSVGQKATIDVTATGKSYEGYITNISSTANNGSFTVTVEFENDGNVMVGMSATVSIEITS